MIDRVLLSGRRAVVARVPARRDGSMIIGAHVVTPRPRCSIDSRRRRNAKCAPGPPRRSNPIRMAPPARRHRNWHSERRLLRRCGPASPSIFFARRVAASARRKSSDILCAHASSRCSERAPGIVGSRGRARALIARAQCRVPSRRFSNRRRMLTRDCGIENFAARPWSNSDAVSRESEVSSLQAALAGFVS